MAKPLLYERKNRHVSRCQADRPYLRMSSKDVFGAETGLDREPQAPPTGAQGSRRGALRPQGLEAHYPGQRPQECRRLPRSHPGQGDENW